MLKIRKQTWLLLAVITPIAILFLLTVRSAGPIAPVDVVLDVVVEKQIEPAIFGIGTVQAQYSHKIGPTFAGRIKRVDVQVGDLVDVGQILIGMDPVDLDERLKVQKAAIESAKANLKQAQAKQEFAFTQASRYKQLLSTKAISEEAVANKQQELDIANAALKAANQETARIEAEYNAVLAQRNNLELISPAKGMIINRSADPGTTVVAGQSIVEIINPESLWIDARFDQISAEGLAANLDATIQLRSRRNNPLNAKVLRVEPIADSVTEEMLAKIVFESTPNPLPPLGELAEVTVKLPSLEPLPVIQNAAIVRYKNQMGVWKYSNQALRFIPITIGRGDLDGYVQVTSGLKIGDQVVLYSAKPLNSKSRINVRDFLL